MQNEAGRGVSTPAAAPSGAALRLDLDKRLEWDLILEPGIRLSTVSLLLLRLFGRLLN